MPDLTIISHVYNAQAQVDHQLALWRRYDPALLARLEFLLVDDFSDPPLVVDNGPLNLRLLRVDDDIDWNMPGCRNLAATTASAPWLLFFDIDNVADEAAVQKMAQACGRLDTRRLHVFRRVEHGKDVEPHINSYLITRQGYFQAGGYDEDFCGHYGYEDVLFRLMWRKHVGTEVLLTDIALTQLSHRTAGLNRDTQRNQALIQARAAAGLPKPKGMLRFGWHEVALARVEAPAETAAEATAQGAVEAALA